MKPSAQDSEADRPAMDRRELVELSMLADGSLPADRRAEVAARIAASPEQSALLERERQAVAAMRAASVARAPASLRQRIAADRAHGGRAPARRRRTVLAGATAGVLAILVVALVLVLPGGTSPAPSFGQAASLAQRGPDRTAPLPAPGKPAELAVRVDDITFPNWAAAGAAASGERVDRLGGRVTRTVYYTYAGGGEIAYTIVAGPALAEPQGGSVSKWDHTWFRSLELGGRRVVTWRRGGHTCIVSTTAQVPRRVLLGLAEGDRSV